MKLVYPFRLKCEVKLHGVKTILSTGSLLRLLLRNPRNTKITSVIFFVEIGAVEPLKRIASSPSPIASKYAAQALRIIGEEVPHKLTPQVPLWSVEDVRQWVKQVMGFLLCSFHDGLDLSSNYLTVKARTVYSVNVDTQRLSLLDS